MPITNGVYSSKPMSQIIAGSPAGKPDAQAPTAEPAAAPDTNLPDKYKGKTAVEIAEMHMNSERRLGEIQNEVGQLRGLVTDLASVQRPEAPQAAEPEITVSQDELLDDPQGTIKRVVQPVIDKITEDANANSLNAEAERAQAQLMAQFPNMEEVVVSAEFKEFADRTASRQADLRTAAQGEGIHAVNAARRLLEDYQDFQAQTTPSEPKNDGVAAAKAAANVGEAPAGAVDTAEVIYQSDVVKMINEDRPQYNSPSFQAKLNKAIATGNYVNDTA